MTDIIITPASGLIDFQNVSGISSATIQLDGSGNLNIGASAGDIQIGDTTSDVYIGNGVDNVDIVFEQDGEIRGLTGKTITLGQSDSFIAFGGNITGVTTFIGNIVAPTFTSTQATGTAPFTVSSTTVVTNLNADTVDGLEASSFLRSDTNDTLNGNLTINASGAAGLVVEAAADHLGAIFSRDLDSPDESAVVLIASDADGTDDLAFEIRGNATGSSVDKSNTLTSSDTTFAVFADGTTAIGYNNLGLNYSNPNSAKVGVNGSADFNGTVYATTFSGSGASLTNIPNGALDNSTVSYGGVTLSLGGSDATPAFNLQDATNYPYTSLTGITTSIVGDTTPQLGGDLDLNSNDITGTGNINITGSLNVTGVSTLGTLTVSSGIVTATTGIITYYGDGSNLTNVGVAATVITSNSEPSSPSVGDLWYYPTAARLFVYYNDGDSSQWIDASPFNFSGGSGSGTNVSVAVTAPSSPTSGDLWYNPNYARLFIYFNDGDSSQWVDAAPFNFSGITTSTYTENSFVATSAQTTFEVSYEVGYVDVYINGIRLSSSEYMATNGSSVVLDDPATEGDIVDIIEVATNRGPAGAAGADGTGGPLENISEATDSNTYYPIFSVGVGTTTPYINTSSGYLNFVPSTGTLNVNQLNVGITTLTDTTITNLSVQTINASGISTFSHAIISGGLSVSGIVTATDFNSTSDVNLKKDVKVIDDPLAKVLQLNGVSFNWTDTGQSSAGVIAQDVEKVMPEIIRNNPTGYKSLNYNGLIGLLIEAVKEQNETIKSLEQKINTLEERLS